MEYFLGCDAQVLNYLLNKQSFSLNSRSFENSGCNFMFMLNELWSIN